MVKKAHFYLVCLILVFFGGLDHTAKAQFSTDPGSNYDPLDERMKAVDAYVPNYRELMREIVVALGHYVRDNRPGFQIITEGGRALLRRGEWENDLDDLHRAELAGAKTDDERFLLKLFAPEHPIPVGTPMRRYLQVVNGLLLTNQYCGNADGKLSDEDRILALEYGLHVVGVEHCSSKKRALEAQTALAAQKVPVHADTDKNARFDTLDLDAEIFLENHHNVLSLDQARNMLVMMNTRYFTSKDAWINALGETNYDLLIVEPFYKFNEFLTKEDVKQLQHKKVGARRLVFAVMNLSTAEDTRFYWEKAWKIGEKSFLRAQSKVNPAGTVVDYWHPEWKKIIGVYFKGILDLGFDGILLQGLSEHESFERIIPIN